MQIIRDLNLIREPLRASAATIGTFDGVHVGHQKVIGQVVARARKIGGKSVVLTFYTHPQKVIKGEAVTPLITSPAHKVSLIENLGVDICILLDFDRDFARMTGEEFVRKVLVGKLGIKQLFVGFNFTFGHHKSGNIALLQKLSKECGFALSIVKPVVKKHITVSSTVIRTLISTGDLALAEKLLGREYSLYGTVVKGDRRGRLLGYPTANIFPYNEVLPPTGVYAVKVVYRGQFYNGIVNIGVKPTFKNAEDVQMSIEVHLFDFAENLYGQNLEMFFIQKLREERRYPHKDELVRQIRHDELVAKKILSRAKGIKYRPHKGQILYRQGMSS